MVAQGNMAGTGLDPETEVTITPAPVIVTNTPATHFLGVPSATHFLGLPATLLRLDTMNRRQVIVAACVFLGAFLGSLALETAPFAPHALFGAASKAAVALGLYLTRPVMPGQGNGQVPGEGQVPGAVVTPGLETVSPLAPIGPAAGAPPPAPPTVGPGVLIPGPSLLTTAISTTAIGGTPQ